MDRFASKESIDLPPHSRGWTVCHEGAVFWRPLAPAFAGMNPRRSRRWKAGTSCPRIRGD